jgi:DNA-binding response OmpR family regulator
VVKRSDCISGAAVTFWEAAMFKSRILIVEDDFDIANILKITFAGQNYEAEIASRGAEALEKTRQVLPNLIILDILLKLA